MKNAIHDACTQAVDVYQFLAPQLGLALTGGNATLNGTLTGIDAALAARAAAPDAELLPSALADGRFDLQGALSETRTWSGM